MSSTNPFSLPSREDESFTLPPTLSPPHALIFDWRDTLAQVAHTPNETRAHLEALPHAYALLTLLHQQKIWVGLCSNLPKGALIQEVARLGWGAFFHATIGAQDTPYLKPHPAPLLACLAQGGLTPDARSWFVGDTADDAQCAQAAGCTPVLVSTAEKSDSHITLPPSPLLRLSLKDLLCLFKRILNR